MNAIVIEHIPVTELPADWRMRLHALPTAWVTVRIEEESAGQELVPVVDDPAFGIWQDREDVRDVAGYVRQLRAPRYRWDGSRNTEE
jgi:hypothetical protein